MANLRIIQGSTTVDGSAENSTEQPGIVTNQLCTVSIVGVTPSSYEWTFTPVLDAGDELSSTTVAAPTFTPTKAGTYLLTLNGFYTLPFVVTSVEATQYVGPIVPAFITPGQAPVPQVGESLFCDSTDGGKIKTKTFAGAIYEVSKVLNVADVAAMQALVITYFPDGTRCWVRGYDREYILKTTTATASAATDTYASATAGRVWCGPFSPLFFRPTSIGAGTLRLGVRADHGIDMDGGGGGTVARWFDQSGYGNDLIQALTLKQGLFITNATNGRPAIRIDGVDDFYKAVSFSLVQPFTVRMVYKMVLLQASAVHDAVWDGDTLASTFLIEDTVPQTSLNGVVYHTALANGFYDNITVVYNAASSYIRAHGTQLVTGNPGGAPANGFTLGALADGTRGTAIEIAELNIYAGIVSAADLAAAEAYEKFWYALPL